MNEVMFDKVLAMQEEFDDVYYEKVKLEMLYTDLTKKASTMQEMLLDRCLNESVLKGYQKVSDIRLYAMFPPLQDIDKLLEVISFSDVMNYLREKWFELQQEVDANE